MADTFDYRKALEDVDQDVFEIIGEDYLVHALKAMAAFDLPIGQLDWVELARTAHTQKGLAANFNASVLQDLWRQMELAAQSARVDDTLRAQVRQEFARLAQAIRARLDSSDSASAAGPTSFGQTG